MTKATGSSELVERLRACRLEYSEGVPCGLGEPINPDGPEAADRITDLEARLARAEEALRPLSVLQIPEKPQGNAGAYSIRHSDILRARAYFQENDHA